MKPLLNFTANRNYLHRKLNLIASAAGGEVCSYHPSGATNSYMRSESRKLVLNLVRGSHLDEQKLPRPYEHEQSIRAFGFSDENRVRSR